MAISLSPDVSLPGLLLLFFSCSFTSFTQYSLAKTRLIMIMRALITTRQWSRGTLNDTCNVNRTRLFFDYKTCIWLHVVTGENNAREARSHKVWRFSFLSLLSKPREIRLYFQDWELARALWGCQSHAHRCEPLKISLIPCDIINNVDSVTN